jgi:hypothetical protein
MVNSMELENLPIVMAMLKEENGKMVSELNGLDELHSLS